MNIFTSRSRHRSAFKRYFTMNIFIPRSHHRAAFKDAVRSHLSMRSLESPTKYAKNVHLAPVAFIAFSTLSRALFMQHKDGG